MELLDTLWEPRTEKKLEILKELIQNMPEGTVISISLEGVNDAEEEGE